MIKLNRLNSNANLTSILTMLISEISVFYSMAKLNIYYLMTCEVMKIFSGTLLRKITSLVVL